MKKTRNLFILYGSKKQVEQVLNKIQFKGIIVLSEDSLNFLEMHKAFSKNKSIVCSNFAHKQFFLPPYTTIYSIVVTENATLGEAFPRQIIISQGNIASQFQKIAEQICNCDIGDHKSNSSGMLGTPSIKDCFYCRYIAGKIPNDKRTIYRSENFIVIPTIGQFISGYLLIIPNQHVMSNAELSSTLLEEFKTVLEDVLFMLKLTYQKNSFLIWENGSGSGGIGKAKDSIVHSHVHVAPSSLTSKDIKQLSGFNFETISLDVLFEYQTNSYLLVKSTLDENWMINDDVNLYIPRQYIRQILAEEHGIVGDGEPWNWRTSPFSDIMMHTCTEICNALRTNWDTLPLRIQERTKDYLCYS